MEISRPPGPGAPPRPPALDRGPNAPAPLPASRAATTQEPAAHRLYVHLAWTTLDRLPLVDRRYAVTLEAQLIVLCRRLDVEPMQVRARRDRVDLLARIKPVHAVSELARRLKRGSGELLAAEGSSVRWGRGYAAATVAPGEVRGWIRRYATGRTGGRPPPESAG